jgi:pyruvate-formate lyase
MNGRLETMRQRVRNGEHHGLRRAAPISIVEECEAENLSWMQRAARLAVRQCAAETPIIGPDEKIVFTRTLPAAIPALYSPDEYVRVTAGRTLHELGPISNICADWGMVLGQGLLARRQAALDTQRRLSGNPEAAEFTECAIETIDAVSGLAARYAEAARAQGRADLAEVLERVPAETPRSFREALQALRLLQAVVWLCGHYHVGLGRFDQYMWPYLRADLQAGRETITSAEELLAEFFISLNKDSDLYPGVQQGDNGQSLTVGGVRPDGADGVNELTSMVLRVALETSMIDPKINLRIDAKTDLDLLCLGSELTRKGLGFPQYSNDDVVVPALVAHGYALEDARDYTVAACWEFIIPGKGMEVVNIGAVSLPAAVDRGIREALSAGDDFPQVLEHTEQDIRRQLAALAETYARLLLPPAPYHSVLMDGCLESGRDLSLGCKYNNFGVHGACSADAVDALAAVKKLVFEEKSVRPEELLCALDANYEGYEALRARLANRAPKVGRGDAEADELLARLFEMLALACEAIPDNGRGGRIRPGTGSAMYYVWLARGHEGMREPVVGATANGRKRGDFFSANLAPAHNARAYGPTSVLQSFSHIDYRRVCNGGPITMELADTIFRDAQSIRKVAMLVDSFARLGCQQLQLNTVKLDTLMDARIHPEQHRDLIVRVWGWSAYFVDLGPEYQEHIIDRQMHTAV